MSSIKTISSRPPNISCLASNNLSWSSNSKKMPKSNSGDDLIHEETKELKEETGEVKEEAKRLEEGNKDPKKKKKKINFGKKVKELINEQIRDVIEDIEKYFQAYPSNLPLQYLLLQPTESEKEEEDEGSQNNLLLEYDISDPDELQLFVSMTSIIDTTNSAETRNFTTAKKLPGLFIDSRGFKSIPQITKRSCNLGSLDLFDVPEVDEDINKFL